MLLTSVEMARIHEEYEIDCVYLMELVILDAFYTDVGFRL